MEREGEIYSPGMTLGRSSEEAIERDLWECSHAGVCHSVYRYGTHGNGGSYCREITQEVAARLGRLSLAARRRPAEPVRAFLQAFGVEFFGEDEEHVPSGVPSYPLFEMRAPQPSESAKRTSRRKSRAKRLDPEELRLQPQFKLPIAGGKDIAGSRSKESAVESQDGDDAGIERLSLRDARPYKEQAAAWERFDQKLREMGVKGTIEALHAREDAQGEGKEPRRSNAP
jgi:hypothetical protein